MNSYRNVVIKTYRHTSGSSKHAVRAHPIGGQGLDVNMFVECSASMRESHPVGTTFRIRARLKSKENGPDFLYTYHGWPYEVVERA